MTKKKVAILISVLCLVALVAVGGTLAYLNASTKTASNVFTPSNSIISIQLREPAWDGFTFADADKDYTYGASAKASLTDEQKAELGVTLAKNYAPGSVIPKDPTVKNNGSSSVWVAVKLTGKVPAEASITYEDGTQWEFVTAANGDKVAFLKQPLTAGSTTAPVFSKVDIDAAAETLSTSPFTLTATAYAIQTENIDDLASAKTAFAQQFTDTF